jgi:Cu+-exporting ATPase
MPFDVLIIKPGEKVPLDGVIIEGASSVDESMITGESIPVSKKVWDQVIGGTVNKEGAFKIEVTKIGMNTTLQQIVQMVEDAQLSRAPIQRLADTIAGYFVPVVIALAIVSFAVWYYVLGATFGFALTSFISVVIVACPCAMGIATPTAILVGSAKGAENGILIKGGEYLEKTRELQAIAFDKTGTLTKGEITVTDIFGDDPDGLLRLVASLERRSEHPIGEAIVREAQEKGLELPEPKDFEAIAGKGVKGTVDGRSMIVGTPRLMEEIGDRGNPAAHGGDRCRDEPRDQRESRGVLRPGEDPGLRLRRGNRGGPDSRGRRAQGQRPRRHREAQEHGAPGGDDHRGQQAHC